MRSKISAFWPWLTRYRMRFEGEGGGEGDPGGGAGAEGPPAWHADADVSYLTENPEAGKAFAKYKTKNDAIKGAHDTMTMLGKSYRLPDTADGLDDAQKGEVRKFVASFDGGVPEKPEGYQFALPQDGKVQLHMEGVDKFKAFCHEKGIPVNTAQELLNFQLSLTGDMNDLREAKIKEITEDSWKSFIKADCGGNEQVAIQRQDNIRKFLQTQFKNEDGTPDTEAWEAYKARTEYGDHMIELPLLRALHGPATAAMGTGGAPAGAPGGPARVTVGALAYTEMDGKR